MGSRHLTLLLPEPFRKEALGQEEWLLLGVRGYFLLQKVNKKLGSLWFHLGYLPGIVAAGGQDTGDVYPAETRVTKGLQSSLWICT